MDEGIRAPPRCLSGQQRAVRVETLDALLEAGPERRGRVAAMVQVQLDLAEALRDQLRELVHVLGAICLGGVEPRVLRRHAIGVPVTRGQPRILREPRAHSRPLARDR